MFEMFPDNRKTWNQTSCVYWFSGDTVLTSISCGTLNVWAVDNQGIVYQRIGVKAPTSHSLNAAWLPVDMGKQSSTVFTHIATGSKDFMVCEFVNRLPSKIYEIYMKILHVFFFTWNSFMLIWCGSFLWFYEEMQYTVNPFFVTIYFSLFLWSLYHKN